MLIVDPKRSKHMRGSLEPIRSTKALMETKSKRLEGGPLRSSNNAVGFGISLLGLLYSLAATAVDRGPLKESKSMPIPKN